MYGKKIITKMYGNMRKTAMSHPAPVPYSPGLPYKGNTIFPLLEIRPVKFVDMTDISGIKIVKYAVHLT